LRTYELMMIHRPEMTEPDVRTQIGELEAAIKDSGTVKDTDFWGKRRFAYEIDHVHEGYYSVVQFNGEPALVSTLDRALSLADNVVRHKILKVDRS